MNPYSFPRKAWSLLLLAFLIIPQGFPIWADPLDSWHVRSPDVTLEGGRAGRFDGPVNVIVGDHGTIAISVETSGWVRVDSGTRNTLLGITFAEDVFVAVGEFGEVVTSRDGVHWAHSFSGTFNTLRSVAYGNGSFVAVGDNSQIITSSDGVLWRPAMTGSIDLRSVCYGRGLFLVVGDAGVVLTSKDGVSWAREFVPTVTDLNLAVFEGGQFVIAGFSEKTDQTFASEMMFSSDGHTWGLVYGAESTAFVSIVKSETGWLGAGQIRGRNNPNDQVFTLSTFHASPEIEWWILPYQYSPIGGEIRFMNKLKGGGYYAFVAPGHSLVSADGTNWHSSFADRVAQAPEPSRVVVADQGFAGLTYQGAIARSVNGVDWTVTSDVFPQRFCCGSASGFAYENGVFLALQGSVILTSSGTGPWEIFESSTLGYQGYLFGVAYGNQTWVVLGTSAVFTSTDAKHWSAQWFDSSDNFSVLRYMAGRFVVWGSRQVAPQTGLIMSSADGSNWIRRTVSNFPSDIVHFNGQFIALTSPGSDGVAGVLKSRDAVDWTFWPSSQPNYVYSLTAADGVMAALGFSSRILTSLDGNTWTIRHNLPSEGTQNSRFGFSFQRLLYAKDRLWAFGSGAAVVQSDPLHLGLPEIVEQPQDRVVSLGATISLTSRAEGSSPISYQWLKDGHPVLDATNAFLFLMRVQESASGRYEVLVENELGPARSQAAVVTVLDRPEVGLTLTPSAALHIRGGLGRLYTIQSVPFLGKGLGWSTRTNLQLIETPQTWVDPDPVFPARFYRVLPSGGTR